MVAGEPERPADSSCGLPARLHSLQGDARQGTVTQKINIILRKNLGPIRCEVLLNVFQPIPYSQIWTLRVRKVADAKNTFPAVLRIHDILVWIRIRGSMP